MFTQFDDNENSGTFFIFVFYLITELNDYELLTYCASLNYKALNDGLSSTLTVHQVAETR